MSNRDHLEVVLILQCNALAMIFFFNDEALVFWGFGHSKQMVLSNINPIPNIPTWHPLNCKLNCLTWLTPHSSLQCRWLLEFMYLMTRWFSLAEEKDQWASTVFQGWREPVDTVAGTSQNHQSSTIHLKCLTATKKGIPYLAFIHSFTNIYRAPITGQNISKP